VQPTSTQTTVEINAADGTRLVGTWHSDPTAPQALPLVLLHGLSQQRWFWNPVLARCTLPEIVVLDQRGHGDSDTAPTSDFSVERCAQDVVELMDHLGWSRCAVVGHSWGASVALRAGTLAADQVAAIGLIDGGVWGPRRLGPREVVRERLRPPTLGIPADDLWQLIRAQPGVDWTQENLDALAATYRVDDQGLAWTRIGMERHMAVLDGLLDYDPTGDLAGGDSPIWVALCQNWTGGESADPREEFLRGLPGLDRLRIQRWVGAVHDVPLQWPWLVAGLLAQICHETST
jgi:pimeloyl-ACP methyl ester carboxylesterase